MDDSISVKRKVNVAMSGAYAYEREVVQVSSAEGFLRKSVVGNEYAVNGMSVMPSQSSEWDTAGG